MLTAGRTVLTYPTLVRRPAPGEVGGRVRSAAEPVLHKAQGLLEGDAVPAQLGRFALTGGLSTLVQLLLFSILSPAGTLLANAVAWSASTALANELHRRRTFHADARVSWLAAQWEGGGLAVIGLAMTTGALAGLSVVVPDAPVVLPALLVLTVNVTVGALRFLALRWAFTVRPLEV